MYLLKTRLALPLAAFVCVAAAACQKTPAAGQDAPAEAAAQSPGAEPQATPTPKPMPAELPAVLARVNGQPVTKFDFDRLVKNIEAGSGPVPAERRDEILRAALDQLISYNVLKQEAAARGITVSDADLDARVAQMQKGFSSDAEFQKALSARNTTLEQLKADARIDMLINKLMEAEVGATEAATETDAREFYDKNPTEFEQGESVRASHILVLANEQADEAAKKAARARIDKLLARVRAGEDFAALAKAHSEDGSKADGGDLGFFERGRMVPPFEQAAFSLKPGEISDVVTTPFGYHIIKVTERKAASTVPYEKVKPQIIDFLSNRKKQQRAQAFIEEARKKARIEVLV